ncbi:MAG: aminotransferase class V-fold PLP-dependent enzyme [Candidatus Eisenbacteria bacterium]|nr:aminotransferase class V-fold PLP-dependent enzyme [Candidatus Eisenbacteria bacterium]
MGCPREEEVLTSVQPIYLDNAATTPVDPAVLDAMLPYFRERFGNAASHHHRWGWEAEEAVEVAREETARLIGAEPREVVFTSGATESNNLALKGVLARHAPDGGRIVTSPMEHHSVLDVVEHLAARGFRREMLPVDETGCVVIDRLESHLAAPTVLVSVQHVNNETGVIQPVAEIGRRCKEHGVLFHVDGTQAAGKLPISVNEIGADLYALSGHKIYGPKGIGALYLRRRAPRVRPIPLLDGGGHERGLRSGTLNVPGAVGLGAAARLAAERGEDENLRWARQRDRLESGLQELDGVLIHGRAAPRAGNISNVGFRGLTAEALLGQLHTLAVSTGSACTSGSLEPSHVLRAMRVDEKIARASLRFSLGRFTTGDEVETAIRVVQETVVRLRHAVAAS